MKKIIILISTILLLFLSYILVLIIPKNYKIIYQKKDYQITEQYIKDEKKYFFEVKYKSINYPLIISKDYSKKRKLISSIDVKELNKERCLNIKIDKQSYTICSNDNNLKALNTMTSEYLTKYYKIGKQEFKKIDSYKKIDIYNNDDKYFIWNYKGFYLIDSNNYKKIDILKKDNYKNYLTYQAKNYLIIPNYDEEYYFTKIYLLNTDNYKVETIKLENEVSMDTYFLGEYHDKVYFIDKKNKIEYELNLKNKKVKIVSNDNYALYYNGKEFINISINKLINKEEKFLNNNIYNYILDNNTLYLIIDDYKIKVSNLKVNKIIKITNDKVYYISNSSLYEYKYNEKETKLLDYNEWIFNNNNHIFIF